MDEKSQPTGKKPPRHRLLMRGESAVAPSGIVLVVILLLTVGAAACWSLHAQRRAAAEARRRQVESVTNLLAQSAETLLMDGQLSAVRRLVMAAAMGYELSTCRIVLPNGQIVADADPSRINARNLPEPWPTGASKPRPADADPSDDGEIFAMNIPLTVPGGGEATLQVAAVVVKPAWSYMESQTGVEVIGAGAMLALLVVYRQMRRRLRAMGAVREALTAAAAGETAPGALKVSAELGPEAHAWNGVLDELQSLRQKMTAEHTRAALASHPGESAGLDRACDGLAQGLILVDEKLHVRYANGAAAVFLRARRDDLMGQELGRFIADARLLAAVRGAATGSIRQRTSVEVERQGEEGVSQFRYSIRPVRRDDAAAAMIVIEDFTQQRVAEEARHAFVAQATHELRTPLTNIRLYVETALDQGENDAKLRADCLNVINQETRRLERIVTDMLSVAEIEAGSLKIEHDDVRLTEVFADLEADYQAQAREKHVNMTFNLPPKMPVIQGDRDKIMTALHNLVGNALKYTPENGRVSVTLAEHDGQVMIEVADTGIGIAADDLANLFQKFYRAKDARVSKITGSGLGLALAREVVRLHGGDITVESELNKGSRFIMTLPAAKAA